LFLNVLGVIGTAAMIWVGGGIIVHGLESYGMAWISGAIHRSAELAAHALPVAAGVAEWLINAIGSGIVGLTIGGVLIPITEHVIAPAWKGWGCTRRLIRRRKAANSALVLASSGLPTFGRSARCLSAVARPTTFA
jgi:uncharacterized protein